MSKIRCSYAKRYKATRPPTCNCRKCEIKWAAKWMVMQVVGRCHVSETKEEVADYVESRLKKNTPDYITEAVRELAVQYHLKNFKEYCQVMGGTH